MTWLMAFGFGIGLYGLYPSKEVEKISAIQLNDAFLSKADSLTSKN